MYMGYLFLIPERLLKKIYIIKLIVRLRPGSWIDRHAYMDNNVTVYSL